MLTIRTPGGDEALDLAEFEARVRLGEVSPETPVCFPAITGDRWVCARDLEVFRGLYDPGQIYFRRYFSLSRFPVLTSLVILANLFVFAWMFFTLPEEADGVALTRAMVHFGAKAPPLIVDLGETWRLLTANFVHRDALHLVFNLFVLFNVGGALENAFRPLQYAIILAASALGTTILSLLAMDTISAGASGVVFGCLSGLVVFGLKYREIIPGRYKRFFGGAVVPYVLVFLWIGWISSGIDNWGHLGGLLGGGLATLALKPRLLDLRPPPRWHAVAQAAGVGLVLLVVAAGGWLHPAGLQRTAVHRDDVSGLVLVHPAGWRRTVTPLGDLGMGNGLPDPVWIQARAERVEAPVNLAQVADRWLAAQLHRAEQAGRIRSGSWRTAGETQLAGHPSLVYEATFEVVGPGGEGVPYRLHLHAFARGEIAFTLGLLGPAGRLEAYLPLLTGLLDEIRVEEPRFLRHARAAALLAPEEAGVWEVLEEAARRAGE
jgi:rhomboid protease GluP